MTNWTEEVHEGADEVYALEVRLNHLSQTRRGIVAAIKRTRSELEEAREYQAHLETMAGVTADELNGRTF